MNNKGVKKKSSAVDNFTVSAHYLRVMAKELGAKGKKLNQLLLGTGISPGHFIKDDFKLTLDEQIIISRNAIDLIGEEDIGLRVGRRYTPETHGAIGFLVCSSPNVKAALSNFKRYHSMIFPFVDMQIRDYDNKLVIRIEEKQRLGDERLDRAAIECSVQSICAVIRSVLCEDLERAEVQFAYPPPTYAVRYRDYFPFPVYFSCEENSLVLEKEIALAKNPIASKANFALALTQCTKMIEELPLDEKPLTARTKRILLSAPPGTINEDTTAESLFISKRTFSRQLRKEGTSFRKLRDEILADIASQHLRDTDESIESIAVLLNYFDASNFRRAFKRWFQKTPENYRKEQRAIPTSN